MLPFDSRGLIASPVSGSIAKDEDRNRPYSSSAADFVGDLFDIALILRELSNHVHTSKYDINKSWQLHPFITLTM